MGGKAPLGCIFRYLPFNKKMLCDKVRAEADGETDEEEEVTLGRCSNAQKA